MSILIWCGFNCLHTITVVDVGLKHTKNFFTKIQMLKYKNSKNNVLIEKFYKYFSVKTSIKI